MSFFVISLAISGIALVAGVGIFIYATRKGEKLMRDENLY